MSSVQSNVQQGLFQVITGESLVGKEGHLVFLYNNSGVLTCRLPNDVAEKCMHVVYAGAASGDYATLLPLRSVDQVRVKLKGTCNPGAQLAVVVDASEDGRVESLTATADTYWCPLHALEAGVDDQLVLATVLAPAEVVVS